MNSVSANFVIVYPVSRNELLAFRRFIWAFAKQDAHIISNYEIDRDELDIHNYRVPLLIFSP